MRGTVFTLALMALPALAVEKPGGARWEAVSVAAADTRDSGQPGKGGAPSARPGTVVRYEDARFAPVDPARPDGAQIAVLRGDPATGPSSMLMKMRKGPGALHYHSSDYELVVVEGRMRHWLEGQVEAETPVLGPGSYWHQPGTQPHGDACLSEVCVMFITWSGKRDGFLAQPR
jgi:quercetin dioxygenase-like cupin family protein